MIPTEQHLRRCNVVFDRSNIADSAMRVVRDAVARNALERLDPRAVAAQMRDFLGNRVPPETAVPIAASVVCAWQLANNERQSVF